MNHDNHDNHDKPRGAGRRPTSHPPRGCTELAAAPQAPRRRRSAGTSLPELLVGVALLSAIALSVMATLLWARHAIHSGGLKTSATALARDVLERVQAGGSWRLLDAAEGDTEATYLVERTLTNGGEDVTPAETESDGSNWEERNLWRQKFLDARLPHGPGAATSLTVRAESLPATATGFGEAAVVRVEVQVRWADRGVRRRLVHVETFAQSDG